MNFLKGTTILSLVCILTSACEDEKSNDSNVTLNQPIFEKIDTEFSGIQFQNTIQENIETKENLFN